MDYNILKKFNYLPNDEDIINNSLRCLGLNITKNCNLSCTYCCVKNQISNDNMKIDVVRKAIDFLVEHSHFSTLNIIFYGGESILNWQSLGEAINYSPYKY